MKRAFAAAGFDTRVVHPSISRHYRQAAAYDTKTDATDTEAGIFRAAINGFGLQEAPRDPTYAALQFWARHGFRGSGDTILVPGTPSSNELNRFAVGKKAYLPTLASLPPRCLLPPTIPLAARSLIHFCSGLTTPHCQLLCSVAAR